MNTKAIPKSILAVFLSLLMVPFTMAPMALADTMDPAYDPTTDPAYVATDPASPFASGTGTQDDPYVIATAAQFEAFRDSVNKGHNFYKGSYITLTADIDLGGEPWVPVGKAQRKSSGVTGTSTPFQGSFDGGNHTVTGLVINSTPNADSPVGLFGAVLGGTVKNLNVANANVNVPDSEIAAAAVGMLTDGGTVSGVTTSGSVSAKCAAGGIVGRMTLMGTVSACANSATITTSGGSGNTGGIVGAAYYTTPGGKMTIENCVNTAAISGTNDVGGIVGLNCGFVKDCVNSGAISGSSYSLGGIAGECKCYGGISGSSNSGNVTFTGTNKEAYGFGGIAGWVRYDGAAPAYAACAPIAVVNNTNSGAVKGADDAGGIVGALYNAATVKGNENTAPSIDSSNFAGGVVGNIQIASGQNAAAGSIIEVNNNVSTIPLDKISAPLKGEYVYNNPGTEATRIEDNGTSWAAVNGADRYVTLSGAIAEAENGDEVLLSDDLSDQPTVTKSQPGTVALNLNGHDLSFAPMSEFLITNGTFVVKGSGDVSVASDASVPQPTDVDPFVVKPASLLASPKAVIEGGSYDTDVSKYVAPSYAELVGSDASTGGTYTVMPEKAARSQAKAQVTKDGHTVYYEDTEAAKKAAADDPKADLEVYDQSKPADNPGDKKPVDNPDDKKPADNPGDSSNPTKPDDTHKDNAGAATHENTPGGDNGGNEAGPASPNDNGRTPGDENGGAATAIGVDKTLVSQDTITVNRGDNTEDAVTTNGAAPRTEDSFPAAAAAFAILLAGAVVTVFVASLAGSKGKHYTNRQL